MDDGDLHIQGRAASVRRRAIAGVAILLVALPVLHARPSAAAPAAVAHRAASLRGDLQRATGGAVRFATRAGPNVVTFIGGSSDRPLARRGAQQFIDTYASLFGVQDAAQDLDQGVTADGLEGTSVVKYQQLVGDVPVLGGQIAVQLDAAGDVVSASGESSTNVAIDTTPTIAAATARGTAIALTAKADNSAVDQLAAADPVLAVFDPTLIGADTTATQLVWNVEVRSPGGDIDRIVLIDANDGSVALQYSTQQDADFRTVCDNANVRSSNQTCSSPVRSEGMGPTGNPDVDTAYDLTGVTYNFYLSRFGRDSLDGQGLPLKSTVRYCRPNIGSPVPPCPYNNAFWNIDQMVYGAGYAVDDVVGHELTHGVTQYTSRLFYYGQSGSINESISDVFGELIDQSNPPDLLPDDKWKVGEDLASGPLRNMADPPSMPGSRAQPDRMTSSLFSGSVSDSHGVHKNSGVGNKAAFLISDGAASFNGQTIVGLGPIKTAEIYYQAETTLITPGADYHDLFFVLPQACTNLIGKTPSAISATDCLQVTSAVTATEMNLPPATPSAHLTASDCAGGLFKSVTLFSDDMENGFAKWTTATTKPSAVWALTTTSSQSGTHSLHGPDVSSSSPAGTDSSARMSTSVAIPTGTTYVKFDHSFKFEADITGSPPHFYDGGVVEYSTNGSSGPWIDAGSLPGTVNGYTGVLDTATSQPLSARSAFADTSPSYETTRIDLSSLGGNANVQIRFRIGTDEIGSSDGWFVDDVSVYSCAVPFAPGPPTAVAAASGNQSATVSWAAPVAPAFPPIIGYIITPLIGGVAQPLVNAGFTASFTVPGLTNGTQYTFTVTSVNAVGNGSASAPSNAVRPTIFGTVFKAVAPDRVLDTRPGQSPNAIRNIAKTRISDTNILEVQVTDLTAPDGHTLTPAAGVAAVSLNVTIANPDGPGFATIYPCGTRNLVSNLNFTPNDIVANAVITPISPTGTICLYSNTPTDIIVDINGWYPTPPAGTSAGFNPVAPNRVLDTRPGQSPNAIRNIAKTRISDTNILEVQVTDLTAPDGHTLTPAAGVAAVSLNVTIANPDGPGFATIYPCGTRNLVSNLNFTPNDIVANAVITPISPTGTICLYSNTPTDIIVDINGWFAT